VDFDSLEDKAVTLRDRDSTEQVRLPIEELAGTIAGRLDADLDT
jgi:glycyl-tRNA synthetase